MCRRIELQISRLREKTHNRAEPRERRIGETDTQARAGSERPKMDPEAPLHPGEGPWRSLPTERGFRINAVRVKNVLRCTVCTQYEYWMTLGWGCGPKHTPVHRAPPPQVQRRAAQNRRSKAQIAQQCQAVAATTAGRFESEWSLAVSFVIGEEIALLVVVADNSDNALESF